MNKAKTFILLLKLMKVNKKSWTQWVMLLACLAAIMFYVLESYGFLVMTPATLAIAAPIFTVLGVIANNLEGIAKALDLDDVSET